MFNHAKLRRSCVGDNPIQGVNLPEMERKESHALTFEQGRLVLEALPSPVSEMALVSMTCSLNVAELLALRWKWVNLNPDPAVVGSEVLPPFSLAVRQNYYRGEFCSVKTNGRRRNVPLSAAVVAALSELRKRPSHRGPEDLVFASSNGTPLDERNLSQRHLRPVGSQLELPWLGWHVFRHTHATLGEQIGMALSDRQAQMGHSDVRMTLHYTHSGLDRRRQSIEELTARLVGRGNSAENQPVLTLFDTKTRVM